MSFRTFLSFILIIEALLGGFALTTYAATNNELLDVRVGTHMQFDRVVFELQSETAPQITVKEGTKIEVRFTGVSVAQNFALPALPTDVNILKRIDAYREGEADIVFDLTLSRDATPSELPLAGSPWRLAVDLAPRTAQTPEQKPEYIPGDLPIPTKLAGEDLSDNAPDPAQTHAVLAYFYLNRGDTAQANEQASIYQQLTGKTLELAAKAGVLSADQPAQISPAKTSHSFWPKKWPRLGIPTPVIWLVIFGGGLFGGLALGKILGGTRPPRLRMPKRKKKQRAKNIESELEEDLQALDDAVAQEPLRKDAPLPPPEPELVPEPVMEAEQEVRESVMDRRVRRVLELSREGRSVTDIAEELQMGQDEVKLILDLNQ